MPDNNISLNHPSDQISKKQLSSSRLCDSPKVGPHSGPAEVSQS